MAKELEDYAIDIEENNKDNSLFFLGSHLHVP
jgi:hypothetical protein